MESNIDRKEIWPRVFLWVQQGEKRLAWQTNEGYENFDYDGWKYWVYINFFPILSSFEFLPVVTSDLNDSIYSKCKHERAFIEMLNFYGQEDIQLEVMNINKRKRIWLLIDAE